MTRVNDIQQGHAAQTTANTEDMASCLKFMGHELESHDSEWNTKLNLENMEFLLSVVNNRE